MQIREFSIWQKQLEVIKKTVSDAGGKVIELKSAAASSGNDAIVDFGDTTEKLNQLKTLAKAATKLWKEMAEETKALVGKTKQVSEAITAANKSTEIIIGKFKGEEDSSVETIDD